MICTYKDSCVWCHQSPYLVRIEKVYLGNGSRESDTTEMADPKCKPVPMFKGFVVEPGYGQVNVWQFKIDGEIYGRPTGGSRSNPVWDERLNKFRRRKRGEWLLVKWLPEEAVENVLVSVKKLI